MAKNPTNAETTATDSTEGATGAVANSAAKITGLFESSDSDKIEAIKAPLSGKVRKVFDSYDDAKAAFDKAVAAAGDSIPAFATPAETFPEGTRAAVAVVGQRKRVGSSFQTGIKGLVMFPMPTADGFIADARDW